MVIAPGIGARLDAEKLIATFLVRQTAARSQEIRIDGRVMLIHNMNVAACGVGLPHLDQRIRDRLTPIIQNPTGHDEALPQRFAVAPPIAGQIVIERTDILMTVDRRARSASDALIGRSGRVGPRSGVERYSG
jgi:hypothetical protein